MPPTKNGAAGDILRRHASKIRKLYATEGIKSVKRIMEEETGFPELAVSTWVEKIGDLGIRKNVTSDEWRVIYLHCLCWLEDHTRKKGDLKLKRTKQPIEIVLRGRTYSWNQAWRNMKNAGAIGQLPQPGEPLEPLPPDIEIRAVSPVSPPVVSTGVECVTQPGPGAIDIRPANGSVLCIRNQASQQVTSLSNDDSLSLIPVPSRHHGRRSNGWTRDYLSKTIGISWTGLLPICTLVTMTIEIQNLPLLSGGRALQRPRQESLSRFAADCLSVTFGGAEHSYFSEPQHKLRNQFLSALLWPPTTDLATSTSHKNYAKFFTVVYILSNKFLGLSYHYIGWDKHSHMDLFRELDLVFGAVPVQYLENLIHTRLVSIRAAYEALLLFAGYFKQQSTFQLLLEIGFRFDWIAVAQWGHQLLYYAVSMDLVNVLSLLLDKGCRPDLGTVAYSVKNQRYSTAICEALSRGNIGCLHRLLDRCDVNAAIYGETHKELLLSNFDCFLVEFDGNDEYLEHGLTEFIRIGVDLNKPVVPPYISNTRPLGIWFFESSLDMPSFKLEMRLSVLDYLFYFHRQIYSALPSELSRNQPGVLSRASILLSLEEGGIPNLQQYLDSLAQRIGQQRLSEFLELLIAEQFLGCDLGGRKMSTDLKMVRALASCNVSIAEVLSRFPIILKQFIKLIGEHSNECETGAVQYLIENGANVDGYALSWLTRLADRRLFDLALDHVGSLRELHIAIADMASRNDLQAVKRLIHAGVDLGADTEDNLGHPMSIIARCIKASTLESVELPVMLETLVKEGAVLRFSKRRPQLHHLLRFALGYGSTNATVQNILRVGYKNDSFLPSSLLEDCGFASRTFECLFRHGARLQPGSPLASWVLRDGGIGLVREMLAAGASLNAYSRRLTGRYFTPLQAAALRLRADIVELLLEEGADVNAATKGPEVHTALQAACMNQLQFNESDEEKLKTIQLLLSRGANVNAAPARNGGHTALQATAATGDLAVARLLLLHDPMADVNAPPCQKQFSLKLDKYISLELGTALDVAAEHGRLDMVKLLLSCNALSHRRGESGYDGAISVAEKEGHLAVAELIREHAKDDQKSHLNPYLSKPARHWSEYGYKRDWYEDSDRSSEADSVEDLGIHDVSDSSTGTDTSIPCDADNMERPEALLQEAHVMVCPDVNQPSEAIYSHGVPNTTQPLASDVLFTAGTLDNNTWADQGDLGLEFEGHDLATFHPSHASQQLDFVGAAMDLEMSLGSGIGQDFGVQYADRFDDDPNAPERLIYKVDGDFE